MFCRSDANCLEKKSVLARDMKVVLVKLERLMMLLLLLLLLYSYEYRYLVT